MGARRLTQTLKHSRVFLGLPTGDTAAGKELSKHGQLCGGVHDLCAAKGHEGMLRGSAGLRLGLHTEDPMIQLAYHVVIASNLVLMSLCIPNEFICDSLVSQRWFLYSGVHANTCFRAVVRCVCPAFFFWSHNI